MLVLLFHHQSATSLKCTNLAVQLCHSHPFMKLLFTFLAVSLSFVSSAKTTWLTEKHTRYELHYTPADQHHKTEYLQLLDKGIKNVEAFFHDTYSKRFDVFIQPDRASFDQAYQNIYKQPGFRSECWLVAIGDGHRISIIAPRTWDKEPCTSRYTDYADRAKTQKLITHELVHVFHGQRNADPDLTGKNGSDWFIEGLAFYASGQLGAQEITAVKQTIHKNKVPATLDALSNYPDVNLRYELWGSLTQYIDQHYGRAKLQSLLVYNQRQQLLATLKTNEQQLISDWKKWGGR